MLRLGIIGTGRIAKRAVKEIAEVSGIEITAVYNPHYEHACEFAAQINEVYEHQGEGTIAAADLAEFTEWIDAAYIAAPHGNHYEYVKEMLDSGKHVLCEKPMAFSSGKARELYEIAHAGKLVLMEGIKTEYCPGFKKIQEIVEEGTIGDIADVEATFTRLTAYGCREYDDKVYGGSFTEFGTYCLLPVLRFLGTDYDEVQFMKIPSDTGVDGFTKAFFTYKNTSGITEKTATVKTGLTVKSEGQLVIAGTKGFILVPSPWWLTRYFEVRYEDPSIIDKYNCEYEGDGLRYELTEFVNRISEGIIHSDNETETAARAGIFKKFLADRQQ